VLEDRQKAGLVTLGPANFVTLKGKLGLISEQLANLENVSAPQMASTAVEHELIANRINLYLALGGAF
jgi:hypothetical protein